jgi:HAMP domain-containing protein
MNNLQIAVCVIAIAVAQALMLLLIFSRERDIKELRELVNELREVVYEQRGRIVELRAWLAGRTAAPLSRIKSESERIAKNIKAPEPAITPKDLPETIQPRTTEDELERVTKVINWLKEDGEKAQKIG